MCSEKHFVDEWEEDDTIVDVYTDDNDLVDDDIMTPEEEGFMLGYKDADKEKGESIFEDMDFIDINNAADYFNDK